MSKYVIAQEQGLDTVFFGRCSPSFYGYSVNPESAILFDTEEQALSFIGNNKLLNCKAEPLSNHVLIGANDG